MVKSKSRPEHLVVYTSCQNYTLTQTVHLQWTHVQHTGVCVHLGKLVWIIILKNVIWRGKLSVLWSQILFYGSTIWGSKSLVLWCQILFYGTAVLWPHGV